MKITSYPTEAVGKMSRLGNSFKSCGKSGIKQHWSTAFSHTKGDILFILGFYKIIRPALSSEIRPMCHSRKRIA